MINVAALANAGIAQRPRGGFLPRGRCAPAISSRGSGSASQGSNASRRSTFCLRIAATRAASAGSRSSAAASLALRSPDSFPSAYACTSSSDNGRFELI